MTTFDSTLITELPTHILLDDGFYLEAQDPEIRRSALLDGEGKLYKLGLLMVELEHVVHIDVRLTTMMSGKEQLSFAFYLAGSPKRRLTLDDRDLADLTVDKKLEQALVKWVNLELAAIRKSMNFT